MLWQGISCRSSCQCLAVIFKDDLLDGVPLIFQCRSQPPLLGDVVLHIDLFSFLSPALVGTLLLGLEVRWFAFV
jgi:hypothetical protein